jgi:hypothetical protein
MMRAFHVFVRVLYYDHVWHNSLFTAPRVVSLLKKYNSELLLHSVEDTQLSKFMN